MTRVLYRADVHRNLELLRSVEVEARAVVLQVPPTHPRTLADRGQMQLW